MQFIFYTLRRWLFVKQGLQILIQLPKLELKVEEYYKLLWGKSCGKLVPKKELILLFSYFFKSFLQLNMFIFIFTVESLVDL